MKKERAKKIDQKYGNYNYRIISTLDEYYMERLFVIQAKLQLSKAAIIRLSID